MFEKIVQFDKKITIRLNRYKNKSITFIIKFFAFFGQEPVWLGVLVFYLFIWYDPYVLIILGGNLLAGTYIILPLKNLIRRKRPFQQLEEIVFLDIPQLSSSFPSWHCYNVTSMCCAILTFTKSWIIVPILVIFSFLVCYSRIYLGSHYFFDVIFGIILGFIGFLISTLTSELWVILITYFENLSPFPIVRNDWVTAIFTQWWYLLSIILIYFVIFLIAFYSIKLKGRKKRE